MHKVVWSGRGNYFYRVIYSSLEGVGYLVGGFISEGSKKSALFSYEGS